MKQKHSILVVEDCDEDFFAMNWAWEKASIDVPLLRCEDGEKALAYLKRHAPGAQANEPPGDGLPFPSLVLVDLNLPRMNGRDLLAEIKGDICLRSTPVVIFTSSANPKDVAECYSLGANSYIVKPRHLEILIKTFQQLVSYWTDTVHLPVPGGTSDQLRITTAAHRR